MSEKKKVIYYIVLCIDMFAKEKNMSIKNAYIYLDKYKGIEFLKDYYEAEHLLSPDEVLEDLTVICNRAGGNVL